MGFPLLSPVIHNNPQLVSCFSPLAVPVDHATQKELELENWYNCPRKTGIFHSLQSCVYLNTLCIYLPYSLHRLCCINIVNISNKKNICVNCSINAKPTFTNASRDLWKARQRQANCRVMDTFNVQRAQGSWRVTQLICKFRMLLPS